MPREVLVCHMHDPVLVVHMNEAKMNDELIMNKLNHANNLSVYKRTNGTAPGELLIDRCTWCIELV
jgi:hypothetical protein